MTFRNTANMGGNSVFAVQRAEKLAAEWISCCSRKTTSTCTDEVLHKQTVTARYKKQNASKIKFFDVIFRCHLMVINMHGDVRNKEISTKYYVVRNEIFNSDID